jgi:hypothetical protein
MRPLTVFARIQIGKTLSEYNLAYTIAYACVFGVPENCEIPKIAKCLTDISNKNLMMEECMVDIKNAEMHEVLAILFANDDFKDVVDASLRV